MERTGGGGFGKKSKSIEDVDAKDKVKFESGKVYFGKTEDGKTIEIYEDEEGIQKEDTNPPTGYPDLREPIYAKINPGVKKNFVGRGIKTAKLKNWQEKDVYDSDNQKFKEDLIKDSNKVVWPTVGKKEKIEKIEKEYKFIDSKENTKEDTKPDVWKTSPSLSSTKVNPPKTMIDVTRVPPLYGGGGGGAPEKYEVEKEGGEHIDFGDVAVYEIAKKLDKVISKIDDLNRKVDYLTKNSN